MRLWKDMTPEEKGALLLAYHEGKVIEFSFPEDGLGWWSTSKDDGGGVLSWHSNGCYRVKPQPKQPREFWLVNLEAFTSEWAAKQARDVRGGRVIHVREVLE